MDTITHGIAGALIGKAFLAGESDAADEGEPAGSRRYATAGRVAVWAATLGAVFPDSDSVLDFLDPTGMAVITEHRGLTHSLVLLPLWVLLLAMATRWLVKRRQAEQAPTPRTMKFVLAYAVGIGSHIFLDLINSWGTMIWMPLSKRRVAWDLVFVIDLTLTAIVLAPQMAAWAYARRPSTSLRASDGSFSRRLAAFVLFSLGAVGAEWVARQAGFFLSPWVVVGSIALFAALFFLPARNGWGFGVPRATWCRTGVVALVVYLNLCFVAHWAAYERVSRFAATLKERAEDVAAIPLPPSPLNWSGLVRTEEGVYTARIRLFSGENPADFTFVPNAPPNRWIRAARELPLVQSYLWFARFPVTSHRRVNELHVVQFEDLRFFGRGNSGRNPFTFRVTFDGQGNVVEQGWLED
jgi:membrane-bound metal-dependent hydrolase YbcI (DUF457 family)